MARRRLADIIRYLHQLAPPESMGGPTDAELLERYVRHRDETAFELLLWRHGVLVWNVCRRVLHREADAEDAFQATFLTFVRKAHVIVRRGAVASWLYKVAYRVALEAKERGQKMAAHEKSGSDSLAIQEPPDRLWEDIRPILDEELNRLPERLRRPFVLCYLEGKTNEEAARQLGCPPGTVYSRLARGRETLRKRLLQRGVTLSTAALAAVLCRHAAEAAPAAPLVSTTLQAALLYASGRAAGSVASQVLCLTEGVLRTMFVRKLKMASLVLLVVGLFATGGAITQHVLRAAPQREVRKEAPSVTHPVVGKDEKKKPTVRVVQPVPGGLERTMNAVGHVRAAAQQQVFSAVSGYLVQQLVDIGDSVKKGDLLAEIDARLLRAEENQASAAVKLAEGQFLEARARVDTAEAERKAAMDLVEQRGVAVKRGNAFLMFRQTQFNRVRERSADARIVDEQQAQLEEAKAKMGAAEAAWSSARSDVVVKESKLESAKAALISSKAAVTMAQFALGRARVQLDFTRIVASFDGIVTQRNFSVGDYISTSDQGVRRPLMTVMRTDLVRVVVDISEDAVPLIHRGVPVDLQTPVLPLKFPSHKVSRTGFAVDEQTRTMPVEIDVPNPKGLLRPGMFMTVILRPTPPNAFTIPESCVVDRNGNEAWIYIIRDRKANRTPVRTSSYKKDKVEILEGVKASDLLVVDPKGLSGDSVPVEVKKMP
jgi:HlyD family secretion protein